jgi:hypothetical protein
LPLPEGPITPSTSPSSTAPLMPWSSTLRPAAAAAAAAGAASGAAGAPAGAPAAEAAAGGDAAAGLGGEARDPLGVAAVVGPALEVLDHIYGGALCVVVGPTPHGARAAPALLAGGRRSARRLVSRAVGYADACTKLQHAA